jgi:hypothetical protein
MFAYIVDSGWTTYARNRVFNCDDRFYSRCLDFSQAASCENFEEIEDRKCVKPFEGSYPEHVIPFLLVATNFTNLEIWRIRSPKN